VVGLLHEGDRLAEPLHDIRFGQRLQQQGDALLLAHAQGGLQRLQPEVRCRVRGERRNGVALLGRAEHHHLPADIGAETRQRNKVRCRRRAHFGVGVRRVQACGRPEQHMQPDNLQPVPLRRLADLGARVSVQLLDPFGEGERRKLHACVARVGDERTCVCPVHVAQRLIAQRVPNQRLTPRSSPAARAPPRT